MLSQNKFFISNWPLGTFINMFTVAVGSIIGVTLQQLFPPEIQNIVFQAVGLGTILIGIKMALRLPDGYMLIFIFSLITGGIMGQLLGIDIILNDLSESLKRLISNNDGRFSEGLITAFLLFCIGSMTIVGALEEGLENKRELLYVKSALDGFTSIALASTYGIGVLFSIIPMFIFQGGITILASRLRTILNKNVVDAISSVGGILILGISVNLLNLGKINLENLLPSLLMVVIFVRILKRKDSVSQPTLERFN
ncbi:MAG: DUF554 domain-containing protein [Saprospiraceae bacterium]|nr:DUF554 domain-containing protein [Saprospiraceae bacterium]